VVERRQSSLHAAVRSRQGKAAWELRQKLRSSGRFTCTILIRAPRQRPIRERIFSILSVLRETDGACGKNHKVRLYAAVADSAAHLGDKELANAILRQVKEFGVSMPNGSLTGANLCCSDD